MSTDIDLDRIRQLHRAQPPAGPSERADAGVALMDAIAASRSVDDRRPSRTRRRRLSLLPSVGVLGTTVAVIVAVVLVAGVGGGAGHPTNAAAAVLQRAALNAQASGGPRRLHPDEYWYVSSRETTNSALFARPHGSTGRSLVIANALTVFDRQVWLGVARHGAVKVRIVGVKFLSPAARRRWIRAGRPRAVLAQPTSLPADAFDEPYRQLLNLPTDVDALYKVVEHEARRGSAASKRREMFTVVGDMLREDPLPSGVRAALYRVAARIPGIMLIGATRDAAGRPALAIGLNDTLHGERDELLFDPRTAALLGESSVVVRPPPAYYAKPGTVQTGLTYLSSGIVEHIGDRPRP